jgi:hypothetical protein
MKKLKIEYHCPEPVRRSVKKRDDDCCLKRFGLYPARQVLAKRHAIIARRLSHRIFSP